ncbi:hypothetical protein [Nonomuraea sp. NPDC005650]|uniref:hypothetical protein n=1 Tax=Nonomuraea sp. NPDC005650 TaxID=3157045 RepID=UPI0033A3957A
MALDIFGVSGRLCDHHAFLLTAMLARLGAINADIAALDQEIASFAAAVERMDEMPGIGLAAVHAIITEIRLGSKPSATARHA